ncbi:sensor histidine kinase [Aliirhizobium smilacinae]|uniref:Blue-light-activated histidine kinase n=1 Tax=Aliirhizobium smilacinae TaxID=1395944 RepID=A0A5C4XA93_9HYPH|nr:sensor histidine kinase [Rhizobium smilacinae]TNM60272.1 PAS domain S-box protein [Rhizobium smilacinae]
MPVKEEGNFWPGDIILRALLNSSQIGLWTLDLTSDTLSVSEAFKRNFGRNPDESFTYLDLQDCIHPDDMVMWKETVTRAISADGDLQVEYRINCPDGKLRWIEIRGKSHYGADHQPASISGVSLDITDRKEDERIRLDNEERRRVATETGEVGLWDLDLAKSELTLDDRMKMLNGVFEGRALDMKGAFNAIHRDDRARVEAELAGLAEGREEFLTLQYRVIGIEDGIERHVLVNGRAMRDNGHVARRLIGAARDVSHRVAAEKQGVLLNQEMSHRLKNTLAVVSSIITQTLRAATDIDAARTTLLSRIQTLAGAHEILLSGHTDTASLKAIIRSVSSPHDNNGQIDVEGQDVLLGPKTSLTLALIIHELSTNAAKYGALSVSSGQVKVLASIDHTQGLPKLVLVWSESGGPPVTVPTRKGFGTRLISMGISGGEGSQTSVDFAAEGVIYRFTALLKSAMSE